MFDYFLNASFWLSSTTLFVIGALAALSILLWDWRASLPLLLLVQLGAGQIAVQRLGAPQEWATIYLLVIVLSCTILALSLLQLPSSRSQAQTSNRLLRAMLLLLLGIALRYLDVRISLPLIDESTALFFIWLVACSLLTLALTDGPLFTAIGLLLWFIPAQTLAMVLLPIPALVALLGSLNLLLTLSCSYLILAESETLLARSQPMTDITFPRERAAGRQQGVQALWRDLVERLSAWGAAMRRSPR